MASFTGDGAYDQDRVHAGVTERHPEAAVVVPPRATAVPSDTTENAPTQREGHLQHIAGHGRMSWQNASGHNRRARVEATMNRWKQVIGDGFARALRTSAERQRWPLPSTLSTACWTWDAQAMSASPDPSAARLSASAPLIHAPRHLQREHGRRHAPADNPGDHGRDHPAGDFRRRRPAGSWPSPNGAWASPSARRRRPGYSGRNSGTDRYRSPVS